MSKRRRRRKPMSIRRRRIHVAAEVGALTVGVPLLVWAAFLTPVAAARAGLLLFAGATAGIDGWALYKWRQADRRRRGKV